MTLRRHKLQPRVDLPPFEPWTDDPEHDPSSIVEEMQRNRQWRRDITADRLVPDDIRAQSAERWRIEHEKLLAQEDEQREHLNARSVAWSAWSTRPWWQRLIDAVFRHRAPIKPPSGPGHVPYATVTMTRQVRGRPDYGLQNGFGCLDSSFGCPMPQGDGEP